MASPYSEEKINDLAYYFDDERIAIVKKNVTSGDWDTIDDAFDNADNSYLQVYYHSRYNSITSLTQDINSDIGLPAGLHTALVYYAKYRLAEDNNDLRKAGYYYNRFLAKIKQYPYRKSGKRGILTPKL